MSFVKKILPIIMLMISVNVHADVTCSGKIEEVVKWSGSENISIMLENTGRYIKFTDKTAVAIILTAFSTQENIIVHLNDATITSCNNGWPNYTIHQGYIKVER